MPKFRWMLRFTYCKPGPLRPGIWSGNARVLNDVGVFAGFRSKPSMLNQYLFGSMLPFTSSAISGLSFLMLLISPLKNTLFVAGPGLLFVKLINAPGCRSNVPANCHPPASAARMPPSLSHRRFAPNGSSYTAPPDKRYGRLALSSHHVVGSRSNSLTTRLLRVRVNESAMLAVKPLA